MTSCKPLDIPVIPLEGVNLIEASAGTGKTFTISHLYLRLILEKQYDVRSILVVTFTEAATKELIERIRTNLTEAYQVCDQQMPATDELLDRIITNALQEQTRESVRSLLRKAIIRFDEASIYTIHGFCRRILNDFSFETSILFDTELVSDQQTLIQEICDDFWRIQFSDKGALLTEIALNHDLGVSGLVKFASQLLRMPSARLIPQQNDSPTTRVSKALSAIKKEWQQSGSELRQLLVEHKGLKRDMRTYRQDLLQGYFETLDCLKDKEYPVRLLDVIAMFSQEMINASMKKKHDPPVHGFFGLCQQLISYQKETVIWIKHTFATYLKKELEQRKKAFNIQSFDDLLSSVHASLYDEKSSDQLLTGIRNTYQVALVDEFQDTDPIQYEIFHKIFVGHSGLFFIGDPKQSIYSFRGADIYSYFRAASTVNKENSYTLDTNWRSETGMVEAVNTLFSNCVNPFVLGDDIKFSPSRPATKSKGNQSKLLIQGEEQPPLLLWYLKKLQADDQNQLLNKEDAAEQSLEAVVTEISRLLELSVLGLATIGERKLQPSDIAILVLRNSDGQALKDRLTRLNIPAVITKSGDVFHSNEAQELALVLKAVAAPFRPLNLNTALATDLLGYTGEEIRVLTEENSQLSQYEEHISRFSTYRDLWQSRGFMRMFRKLMADYEVRKKLLSLPAGERKLTNILHLSELIHTESVSSNPGMNGLLSWFRNQRVASEEHEERELRLERDDEAVQISTVFKSKGLQYPIVFCPYMWQRSALLRPGDISYHLEGDLVLDFGSEEQPSSGMAQAQLESLSDLVRLLYVALTRAQNRCYLVCGKIGRYSANPLDYVLTGGREPSLSLVSQLKSDMSGFETEELYGLINNQLVAEKPSIKLEYPDYSGGRLYSPEQVSTDLPLTHRNYTGNNHWIREWGIASYSRFVAGEGYHHQTEDELLLVDEIPDPELQLDETDSDSFFGFPSGRVAGTCLHGIFEKLDFANLNPDDLESIVGQELSRFGLNQPSPAPDQKSPNLNRAIKMINRVLRTPLQSADVSLTLDQIDNSHKKVELEFHFPISRLSVDRLKQIIQQGLADNPQSKQLVERLSNLSFKPIAGFMHGFMDLVFQYNGKYYIADWKSNNLGSGYVYYQPEKLGRIMTANLYDLQSYIYSVALNQYLAERLPAYDYASHFGGIFYLFIRGIHPDLPGNGIFYDLPSQKLVSSLAQMIR